MGKKKKNQEIQHPGIWGGGGADDGHMGPRAVSVVRKGPGVALPCRRTLKSGEMKRPLDRNMAVPLQWCQRLGCSEQGAGGVLVGEQTCSASLFPVQ